MDPKFLPSFAGIVGDLENSEPFDWIASLVREQAATYLHPNKVNLRDDGMVFLLVNIANLVVIPWERTMSQGFRSDYSNSDSLRKDVGYILSIGLLAAQVQNRDDVSANMLLNAVAALGEGLTIRSLQLWGPVAKP